MMTSNRSLKLPDAFKQRISDTFAEKGVTWLAGLPDLIAACEARFNLKIGLHCADLSFNYTAAAQHADGSSLVIKLCVPTADVAHEINALEAMRGKGTVQLLDSDSDNGILLLEHVVPGKQLSSLENDATATTIATDVMTQITRPVPDKHNFPTTQQWFARLDQPIYLPAGFEPKWIDIAQKIAGELHQDMHRPVLLHGDLHHFNILSSQRQAWLAIDPKGVIGEREYEVGALLRNPTPNIITTLNTKKILPRRIDQLADQLGFDRQKIIAWGIAQAVLATVWSLDSQAKDWKLFLRCAEILDDTP